MSESMKHKKVKRKIQLSLINMKIFLSLAVFGMRTSGQKGCIMALRNICLLQGNTK